MPFGSGQSRKSQIRLHFNGTTTTLDNEKFTSENSTSPTKKMSELSHHMFYNVANDAKFGHQLNVGISTGMKRIRFGFVRENVAPGQNVIRLEQMGQIDGWEYSWHILDAQMEKVNQFIYKNYCQLLIFIPNFIFCICEKTNDSIVKIN
jgi:hypothetical protein